LPTVQRISPEASSKVQIQLVLHDGNNFTFQFTNDSPVNAKKERDEIKELLAQLIPAHRKKANKELEEKNRYHTCFLITSNYLQTVGFG